MSKFKVGDRIAVYTQTTKGLKRITGEVTGTYDDGKTIEFQYDNSAMIDVAWLKQCRKLKPKAAPLSVWVNLVPYPGNPHVSCVYGQTNWSKESAEKEALRNYGDIKVKTFLMRQVKGKK